tara:strand:- start:3532 stop:4581 length:1050 start_codon:yes stop_codon:yes gene_type:complete
MAGILDSKTRFIDLLVTQEGKRQIASGELRAVFASISDSAIDYNPAEPTSMNDKIYFEVAESPANSIVIEKDDSGRLFDFNFSPTGSIVGNDIFDKDATSQNSFKLNPVTGSAFASTSTSLMQSFLTHFKAHQIVGSKEDEKAKFKLDKNTIGFAISNTVPFKNGPTGETVNVDDAEPFFFDAKLAHLDNFKFLPPVNADGSKYGYHEDFRSLRRETLSDIKRHLGHFGFRTDKDIGKGNRNKPRGYRVDYDGDFAVLNTRNKVRNVKQIKQHHNINFEKTSARNNLIMQIFEDGPDSKLIKLDIVDAGSFYDKSDSKNPEKRVFYAGKVFFDSFNTPTFINIFTIIFE